MDKLKRVGGRNHRIKDCDEAAFLLKCFTKHCGRVRLSDEMTPKKIKTKSKWDILIEEAATWFKKPQT